MSAGNGKRTAIRLADLERTVGEVELPTGRIVGVREFDGTAAQMARELDTLMAAVQKAADDGTEPPDVADHLETLWDITARCLPTATVEEVRGLTPVQCWAVIKIAGGKAAEVERILGNGSGPLAVEGAPDPMIPSATSSPALP
jgi:hypothetical protein